MYNMAIYGMKDAANLIFKNKATGNIDLYIDYANATSSEWTSEAVFATRKGTNAIRWDGARNGTLTLDTELFDLSLLAMLMGSDIEEGSANVFERKQGTLDGTRALEIGDALSIKPESISVVKLKGAYDTEHDGRPLYNASNAALRLPAQLRDVSIAVNDTTAKINFPSVNDADGYLIMRDGEVVSDTEAREFVDTGLTPETPYEYTVRAYNAFGRGPLSAAVEATTAVEGVKDVTVVTATQQARIAAANNVGEVAPPTTGEVTYSYSNGVITFTEEAVPGDTYAVYFMNTVHNARKLTISSNKFADSYEIYANATIRPQDGSADQLIQIKYFNAKPQPNFTLTQSATEPTSFSIVFDIMPQGDDLAEFVIVQ